MVNGPSNPPMPSWKAVRERGYLPICFVYTRFVNQYLALPVTYLFWRMGVHPSTVTSIGLLFTLAGAGIILFIDNQAWEQALAGYLCLFAGYVLDSSDGQLARVAEQGSKLGLWYDHFSDAVKIIFVNAAFAWLFIRSYHSYDPMVLKTGLLAAWLSLAAQMIYFVAWNFKTFVFGPGIVARGMKKKALASVLQAPMHMTDWGLFIVLALLTPWLAIFAKAYLAYGVYHALITMGYVAASIRAMRRESAKALHS